MKNGELQLTGELLADIFARNILYWNDLRITAINPGLRLPKLAIVPVARQDGSGTTYNNSPRSAKDFSHSMGDQFRVLPTSAPDCIRAPCSTTHGFHRISQM